jgi:2-iminobutanoate/2-iminopropanoate deaminase
MRRGIMSDRLPSPAGPYSHAVRAGETVLCSGQAGIRPDGTIAEGLTAQAEQCFDNLIGALAAAGAAERDVVRVGVFLTSPEDFAAMNEVYRRVFTDPFPARTTVYVGLPPGLLIEVDAMAITSHPEKEQQ